MNIPRLRLQHRRQWHKRLLPLRLRLALWSAALVLVLSFGLLLFINSAAIANFPRVITGNTATVVRSDRNRRVNCSAVTQLTCIFGRPANPLELALFLELRNISLIGLVLTAVLGGAGAYWLAGIALHPVRKVSDAARRISADTLDTRLAIDGPRDEVKELADTFDTMLERLERTFEVQGRFVADVAHELRTPLASLRTNLEVVAADPDATLKDYRTMAATQERALTRLERLVADLLILATSEQALARDEVTLGTLLEEVIIDLKPTADTQQIKCQLNNEVDVVVHGDASLLTRVFSNLVENGIYYNHPGEEVVVTLDQKDGWAVVTVADTGVGMAIEQQAHIFERFYRIDRSHARHKGGVGLGLSIVSTIVQQHGGKVQVESTVGKGSIFTVLLPL
ncbi:MAG: sensor histidine kinase [Ktedonobacteraceae bacterium]